LFQLLLFLVFGVPEWAIFSGIFFNERFPCVLLLLGNHLEFSPFAGFSMSLLVQDLFPLGSSGFRTLVLVTSGSRSLSQIIPSCQPSYIQVYGVYDF